MSLRPTKSLGNPVPAKHLTGRTFEPKNLEPPCRGVADVVVRYATGPFEHGLRAAGFAGAATTAGASAPSDFANFLRDRAAALDVAANSAGEQLAPNARAPFAQYVHGASAKPRTSRSPYVALLSHLGAVGPRRCSHVQ